MIRALLPWIGTFILLLSTVVLGRLALEKVRVSPNNVSLSQRTETTPTHTHQTIRLTAKRPDIFYTVITERPLFAPSRRPENAEVRAEPPLENALQQEAQDLPAPDIRLLGTMSDNGGGQALISLNNTTPVWFMKGDSIKTWHLSAIGPDWIEITLNDRVLRLNLYPE